MTNANITAKYFKIVLTIEGVLHDAHCNMATGNGLASAAMAYGEAAKLAHRLGSVELYELLAGIACDLAADAVKVWAAERDSYPCRNA